MGARILLLVALLSLNCSESKETDSKLYLDADGDITSEGFSHAELMDYFDEVWYQTEHGEISSNDAKQQFYDYTGTSVYEFMTLNGDISLAPNSGLIDQEHLDAVARDLEATRTTEGIEDSDQQSLFIQETFLE